eukprot:CCRYP_007818-RB/>CCRYP_007818-RB protein AED:0.24 eAED:0.24 QI:538/1/1/1/0.33/0/4/588/355
MNKNPVSRRVDTSNDDGRHRASLRVKEKRRQDAKRWSVDGRRRSGSRAHHLRLARHPPSMLPNLHSSPWNDRFMFDAINNPGLAAGASKQRMTGVSSLQLMPLLNQMKVDSSTTGIKGEQRVRSERNFSDRADGELVLNHSRQEVTPTTIKKCDTSPSAVGMRDVGISPFDMSKVLDALEADNSNLETMRHIADKINQIDRNCIPTSCKNSHSCNIYSSKPHVFDEAKINFERIEELLYTMEIEEQLAHRELTHNQLSQTNEERPKAYIEGDVVDAFQDEEALTVERSEVIYNHAWQFIRSSHQQEKVITKNGHLYYHEIVQILTNSILGSLINEIASNLESVVQDSAEEIFRML